MGFIADAIEWTANRVAEGVKGATEGIGQIFEGNIIEGFLNVVSFGVYGNIKDWVGNLQPDTPETNYKSRKAMATGAATPKQAIYGRARVGGQLVYVETTGTDSQYLHMIVVVAPHQVESIEEVYFNDELAFDAAGAAQGVYSGKAEIIKELGDQTSANSTIVNRLSGNWGSTHQLLGLAYLYVRLTYDDEVYSRGMPNISAVVAGKNDIYDPRTATTGWTDNHALCVLDYLRWERGIRATDAEIDMDSFISAANVSDELVPSNVDGTETEKRYTINGTVSYAASIIDNLDSLTRAGAAILSFSQGVWYIVPGEYKAPEVDAFFDESDLASGVQFTPGPGKNNISNTAKGSYIDAQQNYEPVDFVPIAPSNYLSQDGEELAVEIPMPFANSATLARRLGKINIERERYGIKATVTFKYTAMNVRIGDRIALTISRLGWVNKVFRVDEAAITLRGGIQVGLSEDASAVWDWEPGEALEVTPPPALNLPTREAIDPPTGLNITETVNEPLQPFGNRSTLRLSSVPPGDSRFAYAKYQYRVAGDDQWIDVRYDIDQGPKIDVFSNGLAYEFSVQSVTTQGVTSNARTTALYQVEDVNRDAGTGTAAPEVPPVRRLELINRLDNADGWNKWKGPDAQFRWGEYSATAPGDIISPEAVRDLHFDYYLVRIIRTSDNQTLREPITREPVYTYTLSQNRKDNTTDDGVVTPVRDIRIEVLVITTTGFVSDPEGITVANPAPAALANVAANPGFTSCTIVGDLPDDIDFVGVDVSVDGGPVYRVEGNTINLDELIEGQTYQVSLTSVDRFGTGGEVSIEFTTREIDAADVGGLGAWATRVDPVDIAFLTAYMESGSIVEALLAPNSVTTNKLADLAVEAGKLANGSVGTGKLADLAVEAGKLADSAVTATKIANLAVGTAAIADAAIIEAKIANLAVGTAAIQDLAVVDAKIGSMTASKILAGEITVSVDLGDVSGSAVGVNLDGTNGLIQSVNSGYSMFMGPVSRPGISANSLVLHAWDGANAPFWVDSGGNAAFGQLSLSASGAISSPQFDIDSAGNASFSGDLVAASGSFSGTVTIQAGSTGVANLSDSGALATADDADWQTQVTGTGKPADNADVTKDAIEAGTTIGQGYAHFNGTNAEVAIGANRTFESQGIQLQYNSGTPRAYVGDGDENYMKFDGVDFEIGYGSTLKGVPSIATDVEVYTMSSEHSPYISEDEKKFDNTFIYDTVPTIDGSGNLPFVVDSNGPKNYGLYVQPFRTFKPITANRGFEFRVAFRHFTAGFVRDLSGANDYIAVGVAEDTYSLSDEMIFFVFRKQTATGDSFEIDVITRSGGTETRTNNLGTFDGTLSNENRYLRFIKRPDASKVEFYIDAVLVATHTTDIPNNVGVDITPLVVWTADTVEAGSDTWRIDAWRTTIFD